MFFFPRNRHTLTNHHPLAHHLNQPLLLFVATLKDQDNGDVRNLSFLGCFGRTSHFQTSIDLAPRLTGQVLVVQLRLFLGMVWYGMAYLYIYIYVCIAWLVQLVRLAL